MDIFIFAFSFYNLPKYFIQKNQLIFYVSYITGEPNYFIDVQNNETHNIHCSADHQYHKNSYAESFDKFLMQTAFLIYEQNKYRNEISFGSSWNDIKDIVQRYGDERLMQAVYHISEKQGFKTAWFSDKWHYFGFKENTCLFVVRDFAFCGYVVSNNMSEVGNVVEELNALLNTQIQEKILES